MQRTATVVLHVQTVKVGAAVLADIETEKVPNTSVPLL